MKNDIVESIMAKRKKKKEMEDDAAAEGDAGVASPTKTATSTNSPTKTDTSTSTTGNKTKTGGSNPGGASTGGAGTVTVTTGANSSIRLSNVGGTTTAENGGGMDPNDYDDDMKMAEGGPVLNPDKTKSFMDGFSGTKSDKPPVKKAMGGMAEGGMVDDDHLDQEHAHEDKDALAEFLTANMDETDFGSETYPDDDDTEHESKSQGPKSRMKARLSRIMGLR